MTDRELLELAAKAAGVPLEAIGDGKATVWVGGVNRAFTQWNPLTNDGDALRLAVSLQISIENECVAAGCVYCTKGGVVFDAVYSGGDEGRVIDSDFAAARRAIVIAAAEIGGDKS